MTKLPGITGKQLITAPAEAGLEVIRIRGSHHYLRHADGRATVAPVHAGENIGPGLMTKILRDCELTRDDLRNLI